MLFGGLDEDLRGGKTTFADLFNLYFNGQAERVDGADDGGGVHAGVDKGAERHVAADAAETVEMGCATCCYSLRHARFSLAIGISPGGAAVHSQGCKPLDWGVRLFNPAPEGRR